MKKSGIMKKNYFFIIYLLFHIAPPLYVQNKNGSRDCKSIPHLNLTFFAHYSVLSSRVANRCDSNKDALCAEMSSCSNSCQTSFFRHRDTAETDVPKSDAISVSVFPAKDISHAVKIVFVFERRILNSSRKCVKISFPTLYVVNSTLLNAPCQLKITKNCVFLRKKRKTHQNKCEIHKKSVKYYKVGGNSDSRFLCRRELRFPTLDRRWLFF